jgi:hypothetical protein
MTKVQPTTATGGRKLTEATKEKLRQINKAKFAAKTPEEQAAQLARLKRPKKAAGAASSSAGKSDPPPAKDPPAGGRVNPLAMTPLELIRSIRGRSAGGDPADR